MRAIRHTLVYLGAAGAVVAGCSFDPTSTVVNGGDIGPGESDATAGIADAAPKADARVVTPDAAGEPDAAMPPGALVHAPRTGTAPALDGIIEPLWADAPIVDFDIADAELALESSHPAYSPSASVRARFLHDDQNIYVLFEVTDDVLFAEASSLRDDDALVIFLDGAGDASGPFGADDHTLIVNAAASYYDYSDNELTVTGALDYVDDGYVAEYSLTKAEIGGVSGPDSLGFNLAIIDNDLLGNSNVRDAFALWHLPEGPFCADCCEGDSQPWCDTSMFASLVLDP